MESTDHEDTIEEDEDDTVLVITPKGRAMQDSHLMLICLDLAGDVMDKVEKLPGDHWVPESQTDIAIALFNRATRLMPEQERVFSKALEYLDILAKEKEADMEREEKLRDFTPTSRPLISGMGMGLIRSSARCHHPGLRMLHVYLSEPGDAVSEIIEAMTTSGPPNDFGKFLLCPHCRALVHVENVRNGELWNEEAEASRKAANEAAGEDR